MAVIEKDGLYQYIDENGNIYILYPVTKFENVTGTGKLIHSTDGKTLKTLDGTNIDFTPQAELVQTLGDSEDKAVSQKVVTFHLTDHTNRITNLEQKLDFTSFVTDDSVAYAKTVPANALPYAEVNKIGGMTRKCANLFDLPETLEFTQAKQIDISLPAGTYAISYSGGTFGPKGRGAIRFRDNDIRITLYPSGGTANIVLPKDDTIVYLYSNGSAYVDSADITATVSHLMLNIGDTALPYEPYFEGLRSAEVTEIESIGVNLIPYPYANTTKTVNGVTFVDNGDGSVTANGTATEDSGFVLASGFVLKKGMTLSGSPKDGNSGTYEIQAYLDAQTFVSTNAGYETVKNDFVASLRIVIRKGYTANNLVFKPMLNYGGTVKPYSPYFHSTHPIPEAVKALDGYGWGINESVYNYVDFENKKFVKRVSCVEFTGTEQWVKYGTNQYGLPHDVFKTSSIVKYLSDRFKYGFATTAGSFFAGLSGIAFNTDFETLGEWKAYLVQQNSNGTPVTMCFELAEPIITDISDILTDGNYIEVESGGTITMVNEHQYDVPSEITYQIKRVMS